MTTKEEYLEALNQMKNAFHDTNFLSVKAIIFDDNLNLLRELVNEHFEERQETNQEHFKDEFIEIIKSHLALVSGEPRNCSRIDCSYCDFNRHGGCDKKAGEVVEWLKQPYKKSKYKLTQFEYDLIQTYSYVHEGYTLSKFKRLIKLKDKGYFKCADYDTKIQDILSNCEVIKQ